ncbi:MAG: tetratricopeptide repeat protein [Flavobacteriales bacterium]|nr:tetratricopeptide repeat protein [Flavobacteriales bacterium]
MSLLGNKIDLLNTKTIGLVFIAIVISCITLWPSLDNDFTNWDDAKYVLENDLIKDLTSENIYKMFFEKDLKGRSYVPLTLISWAIEYDIWGEDPIPFHRHNLILHLLNVALLFFFIYILSARLEIAFITSLLFGIHPMHVESIAWVSERKDVLFTLFYFSSLLCYVQYIRKGVSSKLLYTSSLVLFFLGIASKSAAVPLTGAIVLIDFLLNRKFDKKLIIEKIPFVIISFIGGISALIAAQSTSTIASVDAFSIGQRFMFAFYGMITYIYKVFVPLNLTAYYPYPFTTDGFLPIIFYLAPIIGIALLYVIYRSFKHTKVIVFGFLFYLFNVVLVLQFMPVGPNIMCERYTYVSYVGLFFLIGHGYTYLKDNPKLKTLIQGINIAFVLSIITLSVLTFNRCKEWKNSETLWTSMIEIYPNVDHGYTKRGSYYGKRGDFDKAFNDYNISIQLKPNDHKVFNNMGNIYGSRGEHAKALEHFFKALEIDPTYKDAYLNIAITYSITKQYEESFKYYDKAIEMGLKNLKIYTNRAQTYYTFKNYQAAIDDYSLVLQTRRFDKASLMYRGLSYYFLQNYDTAIADFNLLIQVDPQNSFAHNNRSLCYNYKGNYKLALSDALMAQKLGLQVNENYLNELKNKN